MIGNIFLVMWVLLTVGVAVYVKVFEPRLVGNLGVGDDG